MAFFEVHKGEWVRSDSALVGPYKTCKGHGLIERHCSAHVCMSAAGTEPPNKAKRRKWLA